MGLNDDARSAVYYTSLLVNVGCHSDAHEQAKWFGDDIELKSHKYDYDQKAWWPQQHHFGASASAIRRFTGSESGWSSRCQASAISMG